MAIASDVKPRNRSGIHETPPSLFKPLEMEIEMKTTRLVASVASVATLLIGGCASSLAPSESFNDWSNAAEYHHYSEQRSSVASQTVPSSLAKAP